jgi:hypothetical protein
MKKNQLILILLIILLYISLSYVSYESFRNSKEVKLRDTNLTVINIKQRVSINSKAIYDSNFKLWDLEINSIFQKRQKKEKNLFKLKEQNSHNHRTNYQEEISNINASKRKICLNDKCWRFMGIVTINNYVEVTLLSTDSKPKLETFTKGDILLKGITISKITGDSMILINKKDKKKFILKLFDINASAYLPKNKKESNE